MSAAFLLELAAAAAFMSTYANVEIFCISLQVQISQCSILSRVSFMVYGHFFLVQNT